MSKEPKSLVEEFRAKERDIVALVIDQKDDYFASDCWKILKRRMKRLDDSVDLRFNTTAKQNDFKSKICMPLVREKFKIFTGMVHAAFRSEPLVTILPDADTTYLNAAVAQKTFDQNLRRTEYRNNVWREIVIYLGRYGVAVSPMRYRRSTSGSCERTVDGPFGIEVKKENTCRHNVWNYACNPLNYFQNKSIVNPKNSDYQGYIERVPLSVLINEYRGGVNVIRDNLEDVISRAMNESVNDARFFQYGRATDWYRVGVDVTYRWGRLPVEGHEGDERCYYLEMVGDKIIRFGTNPNDNDLIPISIYRADTRLDYWWGNTPIENSVPMENFLNLILGLRADQAMQAAERFLFYDASAGIDPADLNNRKQNGGYVRYNNKGQLRAQDIFYEYQPREYSAASIEPIIREAKEADQRLSFDTDYTRRAVQGGPQNSTATAAVIMDARGNTLKSELLEGISFGLVDMARGNVTILQRMLPDYFKLYERGVEPITVYKGHLLGTYDYKIQTALTKNEAIQMQNLVNFLTQMANLRNVAPDLAQMRLLPVAKELTQKYGLDVDIEEIFPPQMAEQPPEIVQSGGGMGIGEIPSLAAPQGAVEPVVPPRPFAGAMAMRGGVLR